MRVVILAAGLGLASGFVLGTAIAADKGTLAEQVRAANSRFMDVKAAVAEGYSPIPCASSIDGGAMGIHYVNGHLVGDGEIDVEHPEALIYEPVGNRRRLLGVEYIVDAASWLAAHDNVPPQLEGQGFQLVPSPNRFGIPAAFFELHVWAWRDNPQGAFVDWNNDVTCERQ